MARKNKGKTQRQQTLTEAELSASVDRTAMWTGLLKILIYAICIPISILALYPVTTLLAGEETVVNVTVTLSLAVAFSISTCGSFAWGAHRHKAAKDARKEISKLRKKLLDAETQSEVSSKRVLDLEGDLSGVREDLNRMRGA